MSFDVNWDIDKYQEEHESDDHWQLRRNFMDRWKQSYPEDRLVCLSRVFANIEFMGCRYPQEVMQEVARMSKEVNKNYTTNFNYSSEQFVAQASVSAQSRTPRNETIQASVISEPVGMDSYIDSTSQGFGEDMNPSNEVMQAPVGSGLFTSFIYENLLGQNDSDNCTELEDSQQQSSLTDFVQQSGSVVGNIYQSNGSGEPPLWHRWDPTVQASVSIPKEADISQPDRIQSLNWQARDPRIQLSTNRQRQSEISQQETNQATGWQAKDPRNQASAVVPKESEISQYTTQTTNNYWQAEPRIQVSTDIQKDSNVSQYETHLNQLSDQGLGHTNGTHNMNQYEPISEPTTVDEVGTPGFTKAAQHQTISTNDQNSHEPNMQSYGFGNMATTSGSGLITQPQLAYNTPLQTYNRSFQNNYNEVDPSTYSGTYPLIKRRRTNKIGKHNIIVSGQKLSGSTARRFAYWINVGKTQQEAEYLCKIHMRFIPEYEKLKKTMGTVCQLTRLKGDVLPTFKKRKGKPLPLKKVPVGNQRGEAATANNEKSIFDTPTEFKTMKQFKRYKFWLSIGKSDDVARVLSEQGFRKIPLANELRARARAKGHEKTWMKWAQKEYLRQKMKAKNSPANKKGNPMRLQEQFNAKNSLADETINTAEAKETINTAEVTETTKVQTYEDPDIIEIRKKEPETIFISDDEEVDKSLLADTSIVKTKKNDAAKPKIDNEIQRKRFDWWIQQGKSQEEATILSERPMAISDALDNISNCKTIIDKELQEKNLLFNPKKTYSKDAYTPTPITTLNTFKEMQDKTEMIQKSQLHEKWVTSEARENQNLQGHTLTDTQGNPITMPTITNANMIHENPTAANCSTLKKNATPTETNEFKIYIEEASGKIGYNESLQIRDAIARCIVDDDEITMPTCGIMHGCFVVVCANEHTRDSLDKQIPTLEPWKGSRLKIIDKIVVKHKMSACLFVPSIPESGIDKTTEDREVLKKLHEQNPKIGCSKWGVISHLTQVHKTGRLLTVNFDSNAKNELGLVGYKLKWFIRPIKVKLKNRKQIKLEAEHKHNMHILDPPNIDGIKSASLSTGKVTIIMPQAEVCLVQKPYNMAEKTTGLLAPSIIGDEVIPMEISDSPSPPRQDYSEHACPSNNLPILKKNGQATSNYENDAMPQLEYFKQPTISEEQSTQNTSSTIANQLRKRKLVDGAGYWRTDAPRLLPGHMNAVKWPIENKESFAADIDGTEPGREYCYREVKPFSGEDEEYSIEERVAAGRCISSLEAFNSQRSYQPDRGLADVREYSQERGLDEKEPVGSREDRPIPYYPQENLVLAGQSQEYARCNRFSNRQSPVYSRESRFDDKDAEGSRKDLRRQEYSQEVSIEHERKHFLEDRVAIDFSQEEEGGQSHTYSKEHKVFAERNEDYSRENIYAGILSADYCSESRSQKQDAKHSTERRVFDEPRRRQEYSQKDFNKHRRKKSSEDRVIQHSPQHAFSHQEYTRDDKIFDRQSQEYLGKDRFFDRQSTDYTGKSRNDKRDTYTRELSDEHKGASYVKDIVILDAPLKERVLTRQSRDHSKDGRYSDTRSPAYSGKSRFDEQDIERYSNNRRFDRREQEYKHDIGSAGRYQEHSRGDKVFDERDQHSRKDRNSNERDKYSREPRVADHHQQYSKRDRDYYQPGGSNKKSSQVSDRPYSTSSYDNTSQRSHSRPMGTELQLKYHEYKPKKKRSKKPQK